MTVRRRRKARPTRDFTVLLNYYSMQWRMPAPVPEYRFAAQSRFKRQFRLDFAWPTLKVGVEIDGGVFMPGCGAHSMPWGIKRDMAKHNIALALGWQVYRFMPEQLGKPEALEFVRDALEARQMTHTSRQAVRGAGEH